MFCTNCGKNIPDKSTICPVCNKEISIPKNEEIHFEKNCSAPLSTSVFFFNTNNKYNFFNILVF